MTAKEFFDKFIAIFTSQVNKNKLKIAHVGNKNNQILWNLFGYKLVPCLEGDDAKTEYDKVSKIGALCIQYFDRTYHDESMSELPKKYFSAKGIELDGLMEFYVIGKDFSWCYVVTHEGDDAGPYFCYAPR